MSEDRVQDDVFGMPTVNRGLYGGGVGQTGLDALLLDRERAYQALQQGDEEIQYRGWWIDIEYDEWDLGWTCIFDGERYGISLEEVLEEIDHREGTTEAESGRLWKAWLDYLAER